MQPSPLASIGGFYVELAAEPTKTSECNSQSLTRIFIAGIDAGYTLNPLPAYSFHVMLLFGYVFDLDERSTGHVDNHIPIEDLPLNAHAATVLCSGL